MITNADEFANRYPNLAAEGQYTWSWEGHVRKAVVTFDHEVCQALTAGVLSAIAALANTLTSALAEQVVFNGSQLLVITSDKKLEAKEQAAAERRGLLEGDEG